MAAVDVDQHNPLCEQWAARVMMMLWVGLVDYARWGTAPNKPMGQYVTADNEALVRQTRPHGAGVP